MNKIEVGQTVYLKTINSLARRNDEIYTATIEKVGKKYATIKDSSLYANNQFVIDTMREKSEYSPNYEVYLTYEDAENSTKTPKERQITITMVNDLNYNELVRVQKFIMDMRTEQ